MERSRFTSCISSRRVFTGSSQTMVRSEKTPQFSTQDKHKKHPRDWIRGFDGCWGAATLLTLARGRQGPTQSKLASTMTETAHKKRPNHAKTLHQPIDAKLAQSLYDYHTTED